MKNILFLFAVIVSFTLNVNAQSLDWVKQITGSGTKSGRCVTVDKHNNIITLGTFGGTIHFENGNGTNTTLMGGSDIFISKHDPKGNLLWVKSYDGSSLEFSNSMCLDDSGFIYFTGMYTGTADLDPGPGSANLISQGEVDIFVAKLDSSGNLIWAKGIGSDSSDSGNDIKTDSDGNVIVTGWFSDTTDFDPGINEYIVPSMGKKDIFILKLDHNGDFVWVKCFGSVNIDEGKSLSIDQFSNICISGDFQAPIDFDPGTGIFTLTHGAFVLKLDPSGNFIWAKQLGDYNYGIAGDPKIAFDKNYNLYVAGWFSDSVDFDPGPGSYFLYSYGTVPSGLFIVSLDSTGIFRWAIKFGGLSTYSISLFVDSLSNVYHTGFFSGSSHFGNGNNSFFLNSTGSYDTYIAKFDSLGNAGWVTRFGGMNYEYCLSVTTDNLGHLYATGSFRGDTVDFDPGPGLYNLIPTNNNNEGFLLKLNLKGVKGRIYNDLNQNCIIDNYENGISNRLVRIDPVNIVVQTNDFGEWIVDSIPAGTYTVTYDTSGFWNATCPTSQTFVVTDPNIITEVADFGLVSTQPCPDPEISIFMPIVRRCFSNQWVYVSACNNINTNSALIGAYADVELNQYFTPTSSSIPYTYLGNNVYRFQLDTINPGQCVYFQIHCYVSCDAVLGQSLCVQANLYPADSCVFDTIPNPFPGGVTPCTLPWDHSSLQVEGYCQNDSIYFVVTNTGSPANGNMLCWAPVRIYVDGYLVELDSVMIAGDDSVVFAFDGDGHTWRLEADQHPLHPGNSHPNATVELCGDSTNWTPGLVTILPQDDSDPVVDIYCGVVTGSYDPNDKTGYPTGVDYYHYILPNQQIQYVVRFQNTGTDTAFTVIVRDTLDTDLNIFSVTPGVASHDYHFYMHGPRVLEWTFYNIMLPDSNVNQEASHGFLTFTVDQNADLPDGTVINNSAYIYFDFNAPVITNQTIHTVNENMQLLVHQNTVSNGNNYLNIYPNPSDNTVFIDCNALQKGSLLYIYDINCALRKTIPVSSEIMQVDVSRLPRGVYVVKSVNENGVAVAKMVVR